MRPSGARYHAAASNDTALPHVTRPLSLSSLSVSAWPRGSNGPWTPSVLGRHERVHALGARARGHTKPSRSRATRKEETMPVRLVITTYAKPGKGTDLAQAMADRCRAVQQEPGCQQFEVFQSTLDPDKLVEPSAGCPPRRRHPTPRRLHVQPHAVAPRAPDLHGRGLCWVPCVLHAPVRRAHSTPAPTVGVPCTGSRRTRRGAGASRCRRA